MHKTAAPWEELREKYEAGGYTYMQLAKEYGVSVQTVGRHARKERWVSGCRNERRRRAERCRSMGRGPSSQPPG